MEARGGGSRGLHLDIATTAQRLSAAAAAPTMMCVPLCGATRAPVSSGAAALSLYPAAGGAGGTTRQMPARAQLHEATSGVEANKKKTKHNHTVDSHTSSNPHHTSVPSTHRHPTHPSPPPRRRSRFAKPSYAPVLPPLPPPALFPSSAYTRRPAAGNNPPTTVPSATHQAHARPASLGRRRRGGRPSRRRVRGELLPQAADKIVVRRLVVPVVLPLTLGGAVGRGGSLNPACTSTKTQEKKTGGWTGGRDKGRRDKELVVDPDSTHGRIAACPRTDGMNAVPYSLDRRPLPRAPPGSRAQVLPGSASNRPQASETT